MSKKIKSPKGSFQKSGFKKSGLTASALIFAVIGGFFIYNSFATELAPEVANIWVDQNGGSCRRQPIAGSYIDADACGSFNEAYVVSQPGDSIMIRGGPYNTQTVPVINGRGSTRTTMLVQPGEVAIISGNLRINADFVTVGSADLNGLKVNGTVDVDSDYADVQQNIFPYNNQVEGVTVQNIDAYRLDIRNTKDLTAFNGDWGPINNIQSVHFDGQYEPANNPAATTNFNTIIDGGSIHDSTRSSGTVHTECVAAWSVQKLTIRNVHFYNCAVYNISATYIKSTGDIPPRDYLFENNIFEASDDITVGGKQGFYTNLLSAWEFGGFGIKLIHNYMEQQFQMDQNDQGKMIVANNIMPKDFNCSDTTYVGNAMVRSGGSCPGNTTISSLTSQVVSAANNNFHLVAGAGAIGAASATYANTKDRDANTRDASPDAGPYEYISQSPNPTPPTPGPTPTPPTPPPTPTPTPPGPSSPTLTLNLTSKNNTTALNKGSSTIISWSSTGTISCSASAFPSISNFKGTKSTSGSYNTGKLRSSRTYTLTCKNGSTSIKKTIKITVRKQITGDVNFDGKVNIYDLSILLTNYNKNYIPADFNDSGKVTIQDLSLLLGGY